MTKYYVVSNDQYYPSAGMGDWHGPFDQLKNAEKFAKANKGNSVIIIEVDGNELREIDRIR